MTRLILIRHGQTEYNVCGRYCGFSDPSLNSRGLFQAHRLADRLKDVKIAKVFSSDLVRAYETAEIIFNSKAVNFQALEKVGDFREMNFGVFEGLNHEDIMEKYPEIYKRWINDPEKIVIPEGEGLSELRKRVEMRLFFVLSQYEGKTVAVVTHGGPIRIVLYKAVKRAVLLSSDSDFKGEDAIDLNTFWSINPESGSLSIIDYSENFLPEVAARGDISHLL